MRELVIGVGNPDRGDDAVGWFVTDLLEGRVPVARSSGDPASLIELWSASEQVIVVDAASTGRPPGTISMANAADVDLEARSSHSSHGLGPAQAVELARALDALPPKLTLYSIEGKNFDHGTPMTPEVTAAALKVAQSISPGAPTNPGSGGG